MAERVPNIDLRFFVTAVILQRQTGGDLAEILDKIGSGGFAVVYKGYDPFIKRPVAIKVCYSRDPETRERFYREAEIAGHSIQREPVAVHPIVRIHARDQRRTTVRQSDREARDQSAMGLGQDAETLIVLGHASCRLERSIRRAVVDHDHRADKIGNQPQGAFDVLLFVVGGNDNR